MSSSSKPWTVNGDVLTSSNGVWSITKAFDSFILTHSPKKEGDAVAKIPNPFFSKQDFLDRQGQGDEIPKYVQRKFAAVLAEWDAQKPAAEPKSQETEAAPELPEPEKETPTPEVRDDIHDPRWDKLRNFNALTPNPVQQETSATLEIESPEEQSEDLSGRPVKGYIRLPHIEDNIHRIMPFIADVFLKEDPTKSRKAIVVGAIRTKPKYNLPNVYGSYHVIYEDNGQKETVESTRVYFRYTDGRNKGRINPEKVCLVDSVPTIIDTLDEQSLTLKQYREVKASVSTRKHLLTKFDNETLVKELESTLSLCRKESEVTYDGTLKNQLVPELLKRFKEMINLTITN